MNGSTVDGTAAHSEFLRKRRRSIAICPRNNSYRLALCPNKKTREKRLWHVVFAAPIILQ